METILQAIYSQLLDTIKEVVSQTLDSAYGTNAPHIATEVLEIALKDNFHSLVMEKKAEKPVPQMEKKKTDLGDTKLLKMLQQNGLHQPDIFNQTTNQLLRLIELNSLNSEMQKQQCKPFNPFLSYNPLQKMNAYGNLLNQTGLFQNKMAQPTPNAAQNNFSNATKSLQQQIAVQQQQQQQQQNTLSPTTATHPSIPLVAALQKPYDMPSVPQSQQQPKIFSPGVIKSEDTSKTSPSRSPIQAFSTATTHHDTKSMFNTTSTFTTSPFTTPNVPKSAAPLVPTSLIAGLKGQMQPPPPSTSTATSMFNSASHFTTTNNVNQVS